MSADDDDAAPAIGGRVDPNIAGAASPIALSDRRIRDGLLDLDGRNAVSRRMFEVVVIPLDDLDLHGLPSLVATLLCVADPSTSQHTMRLNGEQPSDPTSRTKIKHRRSDTVGDHPQLHRGLVGARHGPARSCGTPQPPDGP
jgi:hypothetical protein